MKPESSVIFFPCRNMEETKNYYTTVLELPIYKDLGSSVWFDCGYGYLAFCDYGPDRPMASGQCISFNLPSAEAVDQMYEALKKRPALGLSAPPRPSSEISGVFLLLFRSQRLYAGVSEDYGLKNWVQDRKE